MNIIVTGANRGLGLGLSRYLAARGDTVIAAAREPFSDELRQLQLRTIALDVTSADSVRSFAIALGDLPIDIAFNVAGVYGSQANLGSLAKDLELADLAHTHQVNALGPLRLTLAVLPNIRRGTAKKLVHVTSGMGSMADNTSGGSYGYRMSKAALNMMSVSLAVDLRPEGIASYVINPGWVKTDMGGAGAPLTVTQSVEAIVREVDRATFADSGAFLNWKGNRYPW